MNNFVNENVAEYEDMVFPMLIEPFAILLDKAVVQILGDVPVDKLLGSIKPWILFFPFDKWSNFDWWRFSITFTVVGYGLCFSIFKMMELE